MDCKAAVSIGEHCHGGKTRGGDKANDLDMGCKEKYIPFGVVKEDSADPYLTFGSSAKTSDFIVDCLYAWWESQPSEERDAFSLLKIKADNRPESNGRRTQFLNRAADFADYIGKPVQLQYYPPCHSKYNPVDRCWGILGKHLNGKDWRMSRPCWNGQTASLGRGSIPFVESTRKVYEEGISLSKGAIRAVEVRLERHPKFPKWDSLIRPACVV
jgi:hypothetical protein